MKYLAAILAFLTLTTAAQAAMYRFDAYVEKNGWCDGNSCSGTTSYEGPLWWPLENGVLEGQTYSGFITVREGGYYGQSGAGIYLTTSVETSTKIAGLYWAAPLDRFINYSGGWLEYLHFDLTTGLGQYFLQHDGNFPYFRTVDIRLSNISQVPLPASGVLLLAGLGGLALGRRFKRPA